MDYLVYNSYYYYTVYHYQAIGSYSNCWFLGQIIARCHHLLHLSRFNFAKFAATFYFVNLKNLPRDPNVPFQEFMVKEPHSITRILNLDSYQSTCMIALIIM